MHYIGLIIAITTFVVIGFFHPIVIKAEYHFGVGCWWAFALVGIVFLAVSLFVGNVILSSLLGVVGCASLWGIVELFQQRIRVKKGWFPKNPNRKDE